MARKVTHKELVATLKNVFGFDKFKDSQEEIVKAVLEGKNCFVIMPTGGGKSLCYQLPAIMSEGTAIIISPLIALMKNQVDSIRNTGTDNRIAHVLNSTLSKQEAINVRQDLINQHTKLLYVAPESLTKEENVELFKQLKISFYAIDEAHCISEWGHDFRPEYSRIRSIIENIGHKVPIIALTATATPKVQKDIQRNLCIEDAKIFKTSFNRPNLYYEVRPKTKDVDKEVVKYIKQYSGKSGIIYCLSRKKVEELAQTLQENNIKALPYHAGLDAATREKNQDDFLMERADIIVATIAFGMGIDKPDVRFVLHYDMPKSLEGYYQETGRSGRDNGEGRCIAFYDYEDIHKMEKFTKGKPKAEQEIAKQLLAETISYAESSLCRRKLLLHYFGENYTEENCGMCDNCQHPKQYYDGKEEMELLMEAIKTLKQQFKDKHIIDVLMGHLTTDVKQYKHNNLPCFGEGADFNETFWNNAIRQALLEELIYKDIENYGLLKITQKGERFIKKPFSIMLVKSTDENEGDDDDQAIMAAQGGGGGGSSVDDALFSMLKDLRKEIAKKNNIPPYVVFQDPSLEDMCIQYPITIEEMTKVSGVGTGKAAKYGKPFVDLIRAYVEENEIERPQDLVVKSVANKSKLRVDIIQSIDRRVSLEEIAKMKNLSIPELISEIESIISSGTKVNISYYIDEVIDETHQEEIYDYFSEAESDSIQKALEELGEDEYTEEEIRLMHIKFMNEVAN